ncbi:MAG: HAD-IC family P-type ATPase, partial [Anaerolineae bacterium]
VLLLDKCAAIVSDYRRAVAFIPLNETNFSEVVETARLAALANGTPESESIIALAEEQLGPGNGTEGAVLEVPVGAHVIPYTAETGLSGVELHEMSIRKGAPEAIITYLKTHGYPIPPDLNRVVERVAGQGGVSRVLVVNGQAVGVIHLRSLVNTALKKGLVRLRQMGLKTVLITGDTPFAAATIAAEAGMDDFLARATPATKLELIRRYQADGQRVAITGQGINDTSALIRAKVAVAMNAGAQLAREVANMVDLDSNPAKLIEIVEIGKQRLVTHRALTIFSLANDVAKYLALIPVMFALIFPAMDGLNFMHLATPTSTILAAVIFNALIMVALTPLALRGIPYRLVGTARLQRDILLLYGLSGLATLFIGIKVIDLILVGLGFV